MRVSVIGLGLIGCERLKALRKLHEGQSHIEIGALCDPKLGTRANDPLFEGMKFVQNVSELLTDRPDWVIVCVPHNLVVEIVTPLLSSGISVLVEKPLGRNLAECDRIISSIGHGARLQVGLNYRFLPGIRRLLEDVRSGRFGNLMSVNLILGHGNAPGMEKSWKLDPVACGGGCLIDPGIHLLDLINLLSGYQCRCVSATSWQGFWNTGIEEEVHALFRGKDDCLFNMQASLNRWRSEFRVQVNGTDGYGIVEGRNRSYGPEVYRVGRRWGWRNGISQADSEIVEIADAGELSFFDEIEAVLVREARDAMPCNHTNGRSNMVLLEQTYAMIRNG